MGGIGPIVPRGDLPSGKGNVISEKEVAQLFRNSVSNVSKSVSKPLNEMIQGEDLERLQALLIKEFGHNPVFFDAYKNGKTELLERFFSAKFLDEKAPMVLHILQDKNHPLHGEVMMGLKKIMAACISLS